MEVTVVTAVYNKEEILEEYTLHTIEQKNVDFELILVDDCSPDRCPEIIDNIAGKYANVKVIHRQKNGGHVAAVNDGLMAALGEYVMIVDADDYLNDENALHDMYQIAKMTNADAVFSDFTGHYLSTQINDETIYKGRDYLLKMLKEGWYHPTERSRLYKTSILKSDPPQNFIVDDEDWTPPHLFQMERVAVYPKRIYTRTTPATSVTRIRSEANYFRKAKDRIIVSKRLSDFFDAQVLSAEEKKFIYRRILGLFMMAVYIYLKNITNTEYIRELNKLMDENSDLLNKAKYAKLPKYVLFNWLRKVFGMRFAMQIYRKSLGK